MCHSTVCSLFRAEERRETLRDHLSALMPSAQAGDAQSVASFLEGMDELNMLNTLDSNVGTCNHFDSIQATRNTDEPERFLLPLAQHVGMKTSYIPTFVHLMQQARSKGGYVRGIEYPARTFWNHSTRKIAQKMKSVELDVLCGPKYAASMETQGPQAVKEARINVVEGLLDTWVGSFSYSRSQGVLGGATSSLQSAAERFMLRGMTESLNENRKDAITRSSDAFISAQYALTQEFFGRLGITEVSAYRGLALRGQDAPWGQDADNVSIDGVASLSSYSFSYEIAKHFAVGHANKRGVIVSACIPVSRIVAIPGTGMANLAEHELVVLTSPLDRVSTRVVTQ